MIRVRTLPNTMSEYNAVNAHCMIGNANVINIINYGEMNCFVLFCSSCESFLVNNDNCF